MEISKSNLAYTQRYQFYKKINDDGLKRILDNLNHEYGEFVYIDIEEYWGNDYWIKHPIDDDPYTLCVYNHNKKIKEWNNFRHIARDYFLPVIWRKYTRMCDENSPFEIIIEFL